MFLVHEDSGYKNFEDRFLSKNSKLPPAAAKKNKNIYKEIKGPLSRTTKSILKTELPPKKCVRFYFEIPGVDGDGVDCYPTNKHLTSTGSSPDSGLDDSSGGSSYSKFSTLSKSPTMMFKNKGLNLQKLQQKLKNKNQHPRNFAKLCSNSNSSDSSPDTDLQQQQYYYENMKLCDINETTLTSRSRSDKKGTGDRESTRTRRKYLVPRKNQPIIFNSAAKTAVIRKNTNEPKFVELRETSSTTSGEENGDEVEGISSGDSEDYNQKLIPVSKNDTNFNEQHVPSMGMGTLLRKSGRDCSNSKNSKNKFSSHLGVKNCYSSSNNNDKSCLVNENCFLEDLLVASSDNKKYYCNCDDVDVIEDYNNNIKEEYADKFCSSNCCCFETASRDYCTENLNCQGNKKQCFTVSSREKTKNTNSWINKPWKSQQNVNLVSSSPHRGEGHSKKTFSFITKFPQKWRSICAGTWDTLAFQHPSSSNFSSGRDAFTDSPTTKLLSISTDNLALPAPSMLFLKDDNNFNHYDRHSHGRFAENSTQKYSSSIDDANKNNNNLHLNAGNINKKQKFRVNYVDELEAVKINHIVDTEDFTNFPLFQRVGTDASASKMNESADGCDTLNCPTTPKMPKKSATIKFKTLIKALKLN